MGGSPTAHRQFHPLALEHHLQHRTHHPASFVKSTYAYESAQCLTVSNQFLQVMPNYMLLVPGHKKLMKPLPSIKCDFCVLRRKEEKQKTKWSKFPLAAAWLWGTASPSCPWLGRFGAEGTVVYAKYAGCNGGAKDVCWRASLPLKPWAFKSLQILTRLFTGGSFTSQLQLEPASTQQDCVPRERCLVRDHFSCVVPFPPRSSGLCSWGLPVNQGIVDHTFSFIIMECII